MKEKEINSLPSLKHCRPYPYNGKSKRVFKFLFSFFGAIAGVFCLLFPVNAAAVATFFYVKDIPVRLEMDQLILYTSFSVLMGFTIFLIRSWWQQSLKTQYKLVRAYNVIQNKRRK